MTPLIEPANARVILPGAKTCHIEFISGETADAIVRGKVLEGGGVVAGDHVIAERHGEQWAVERVMERRNEFVRQGLRRERQTLFANADRVLIVASLKNPETKAASIDRFLVAALRGGVPPVLVLTKTDLDSDHERHTELRALYDTFQMSTIAVSNETGENISELRDLIQTGISGVIGNSGVGKSSLLNSLIPGAELKTREVSDWSGKGTHTTTAATLVRFSANAALIDTPGMKSFVPYGITRDNLTELFPDIQELALHCRFTNCGHDSEPGCAVRDANENGILPDSRLRSYFRLMEEL